MGKSRKLYKQDLVDHVVAEGEQWSPNTEKKMLTAHSLAI